MITYSRLIASSHSLVNSTCATLQTLLIIVLTTGCSYFKYVDRSDAFIDCRLALFLVHDMFFSFPQPL